MRPGAHHNSKRVKLGAAHIEAVRQLLRVNSQERTAALLHVSPSTLDKIMSTGLLSAQAAERLAATLDGMR